MAYIDISLKKSYNECRRISQQDDIVPCCEIFVQKKHNILYRRILHTTKLCVTMAIRNLRMRER